MDDDGRKNGRVLVRGRALVLMWYFCLNQSPYLLYSGTHGLVKAEPSIAKAYQEDELDQPIRFFSC